MKWTMQGCWRGLVLVLATLSPTPGAAQQSRLHTLTYDKEKSEWTEVAPPPPGTAEGDLYQIRESIRDKKFRRGLSLVKAFIKTHGTDNHLHPEVLIAQAEAQIGRRDFADAHDTLQLFLSEYSGVASTADALRLEFVIAESFLGGAKRKLWGVPLLSGEDLALQILGEISSDFPDNRYAELALSLSLASWAPASAT